MQRRFTLLVACLASIAASHPGQPAEFHVAPDGDDAQPGTRERPFATFPRAQQAARAVRGAEPVTVWVRGGTYYLADTLRFGPEDSGQPGAPVTYAAAGDAPPVLSGGTRLALSWTPYRDGIVQARVPAGFAADQLFVNDLRQPLARYPNFDPQVRHFNGYAPDAFSPARAARWADPRGGFIHAMHRHEWGDFHYVITGKDAQGRVAYEGGWQNNRRLGMHDRYRMVENLFEELDAPGEWYLNAATGTLYLYPPAGVDLATAKVEAVRLTHLLEVRGTVERPVRHLRFQGLTFRHARRTFMENREPLLRSDWTTYRGGAVLFCGAEDCALEDCVLDQVGGNAVFVSGYNRRVTLRGCHVADAGANGVAFVGEPRAVRNPLFEYAQRQTLAALDRTPGPQTPDYPEDCLLEDCLLERSGRVEKQTAPVQIAMARRIVVRHCSIYDVPRAGINIGDGCWGGHLIEGCDVFDTVKETGDHGAFNSWGRDRYWGLTDLDLDTVTRGDLADLPRWDTVEPIVLRRNRWRCDHGWDIDLDDGSSHYVIRDNLCLHGGLKLREGFYRVCENNVIVGNSFHPHVWYRHSEDVFRRNLLGGPYRPIRVPTPWGRECDFNLLHAPGLTPPRPASGFQRLSGLDAHSLEADAQFVDPAAGDYRVRDGSPALALGFVNFPMDRFGVRKPALKARARTPELPASPASEPVRTEGAASGRAAADWRGAEVQSVAGAGEVSALGLWGEVGVRLVAVPPASAAARAGLRAQDVILRCAGQAVNTPAELQRAWDAAPAASVELELWRAQQRVRLEVPKSKSTSAQRAGTARDARTNDLTGAGTGFALEVDAATMQRVYETVKTPFKYGIVLRGTPAEKVDCPSVFRHGGRWYMIYIAFDGSGYESRLAGSDNLRDWQPLGPILTRRGEGWDAQQAAAGAALVDHRWEGTWEIQPHDGRYWLSYLGGRLKGYETPPLSVGLASTTDPGAPSEWTRLDANPVLTPSQPDARAFERDTLFKSHILRDPTASLGQPFVMFYNARQAGPGIERIGIAVSPNLRQWQRLGPDPVIDHGSGISGDPQIVRLDDLWVMFYFGAFWRPGAFDTFACSPDLLHWTRWTGPDLVAPSEPWDREYAHKPSIVRHAGVVYHFYCAVGSEGRVIALATSRDLRAAPPTPAAAPPVPPPIAPPSPPPPTPEPAPPPAAFPVTIRVDAARTRGEMRPIWRFFGADEPNYATAPHGRKLLAELGELRPDDVFFRAHNLLTSGDGTPALKWGSTGAYRETAAGAPVYDWTILDAIFDAYRASRVRPYVQIGFMPRDLSIQPEPYQHRWTPQARYDEIFTGWAYPPKDYARWGALVQAWAAHCVERYGRAEVERWYWQVWNEPNIGYWRGTPTEFLRLHDHAIAAVRRALPTARVGGPDTAGHGGAFTRQFLEHCLRGTNFATGARGTPLDFVSFHAKGRPQFVDGHVRLGLAEHLRTIDEGFRLLASFPELRAVPIVIGESDPDGCAACQGPQLGYRNTTLYSSYTAASFARKLDLAQRHRVRLDGALTWAFEFEDQPYFAGFRALASNGLDLPVLNVFRMFSRLLGRQVEVQSDAAVPLDEVLRGGVRTRPDVGALASAAPERLAVLLWHYHDDDLPGPDAALSLELTGLPGTLRRARLEHFRIDRDHSNVFTAWQRLGAPPRPSPAQYAQLECAGRLEPLEPARSLELADGTLTLRFALPRQGVSLVILEPADAAAGTGGRTSVPECQ